MSKRNLANEKTIREYETYLKEAEGRAVSTINQAISGIRNMLDIMNNIELDKLNKNLLLNYKKKLKDKASTEEKKLSTVLKELEKVKTFIAWLSDQKGYIKLNKNDAKYLSLSKKEKAQLLGSPVKRYPKVDEVLKIYRSAPRRTEVERRNFIVFLLLVSTPLRIGALMTLPLKAFDAKKGIVYQDPRQKTLTKNSSSFISYIFELLPDAKKEIQDWVNYLYKIGFTDDSPIIPWSKPRKQDGNLGFVKPTEVIDKFIKSPTTIKTILTSLAEGAGIENYGAHAYRHFLAKELLRRAETGEDLKMLSQCFGHKTIVELLKTYGNLDENDIIDVGKRFDDRLQEPATKSIF